MAPLDAWRRARVRAFRRDRRTLTLATAASFALGLWVTAVTVAYARYYAFREPTGVRDAGTLRRVIAARGNASGYALGSVLSLAELRALEQRPGNAPVAGYALRVRRVEYAHQSRALTTGFVSAGVFRVLGVTLHAGTIEQGALSSHTAIISDRLWQAAFARSENAIGAPLRVDGTLYTVRAILSTDYTGIDRQRVDVWLPLAAYVAPSGEAATAYFVSAVVRLPGAAAEGSVADGILRALQDAGSTSPVTRVVLRPLTADRFGAEAFDTVATYALVLAACTLILALCNCLYFLAAGLQMQLPELTSMWALGASPARLWRVVALRPVLAMLAVTLACVATLKATAQPFQLVGFEVPLDLVDRGTFLRIALLGCLAIAVVQSSLLASHARLLADPREAGRSITRSVSHRRRILSLCYLTIVSGVAVALAPVARAWRDLMAIDPGFDARSAVVVKIDDRAHWNPIERPTPATLAVTLSELEQVAGVQSAAISTSLPLDVDVTIPIAPGPDREHEVPVHVFHVLGDFPASLGVAMRSGGRASLGKPRGASLTVNEELARAWPGGALGQCLRVADGRCDEITGIARNSDVIALGERPQPVLYATLDDRSVRPIMFFLIRPVLPGPRLVAAVVAIVGQHFPRADLQAFSLAELVDRQRAPIRRMALAGTLLLSIASMLAFLGLRAMILAQLTSRRSDLGIRMALGANRLRVFVEAGRDILMVSGIAAPLGFGLGLLTLQALSATWSDLVSPNLHFMAVAAVAVPLSLVIAAALPAWSISRAEPAWLLSPVEHWHSPRNVPSRATLRL